MISDPVFKKAEEVLPVLRPDEDGNFNVPEGCTLFLKEDPAGLSLSDGQLELKADLALSKPRLRYGNLSGELLVKAAKIKGKDCPVAVDATAGLGEDSLLLAASGFQVKLYEYDPVIAALLKDSLFRAASDPVLGSIVSHMELYCEDSIEALKHLSFIPDVVLLDPMFPQRTKSAAVGKKFQLIHRLEKPCDRERDLLDAALLSGAHKILIKRPLKGPFLAGIRPSYSLSGKAVRIDVIVRAQSI